MLRIEKSCPLHPDLEVTGVLWAISASPQFLAFRSQVVGGETLGALPSGRTLAQFWLNLPKVDDWNKLFGGFFFRQVALKNYGLKSNCIESCKGKWMNISERFETTA